MNSRYTRLLTARAMEIWIRVAEQAKTDPSAQAEFDLLQRIALDVNVSILLTRSEASDTLKMVTGGSVPLITLILNWSNELRSEVFPNAAAEEEWFKHIAEVHEGNSKKDGILHGDFIKTLPQPGTVLPLLRSNPWLVLFLVLPAVTQSVAVTSKTVNVTFKRYDPIPEED